MTRRSLFRRLTGLFGAVAAWVGGARTVAASHGPWGSASVKLVERNKHGRATNDAMCLHPKTMIQEPQSLVTGHQDPPLPILARVGRDMEHPCGKSGKLFEPGPAEDLT